MCYLLTCIGGRATWQVLFCHEVIGALDLCVVFVWCCLSVLFCLRRHLAWHLTNMLPAGGWTEKASRKDIYIYIYKLEKAGLFYLIVVCFSLSSLLSSFVIV